MDAQQKARISRVMGPICLGLALLNAAFAVLAMVAEKNVHKGAAGIAVSASLLAVGVVSLVVNKRRLPPNG